MMNYRGLYTPEGKQVQMNSSWLPVTPEKPIPIRSDSIPAEWKDNRNGGASLKDMLQSTWLEENIHLMGHTEAYNNFEGGPASQFGDGNGLNLDALELFVTNATNVAPTARSLGQSVSTAARTPLPPTFHPHGNSNETGSSAGGFCVNQSNNYTASDTMYTDANLLVPNSRSEFDSSNSYSLLDTDMHCTFSSLLNSSLSEIPDGDFCIPCRPQYDLNSAPVTEADDDFGFINCFQTVPETMDEQHKFAENQNSTLQKYTTAESPSQEKDKHENLVATTENEYQGSFNGLLQHIIDSSSAAISTPYSKDKGSQSNECCSGSGPGFDLNQTPEQKAPKRKKHRPKVIVEGKPKRTPNRATQRKTESKENPPQKRKYVRKNVPEAPTPQVDAVETLDSTKASKENPPEKRKYVRKNVTKEAAKPQDDVIQILNSATVTKKSCKKALSFDLEESTDGGWSNISSDYLVPDFLRGADVGYAATSSALLISEQDGAKVENQQHKNTDGVTLSLDQTLTDKFFIESQANVLSLATTEEQQINLNTDNQGNAGLCEERYNGCLQQYISMDGQDQVLLQSETYFKSSQTKVSMSQNSLHLVENNLSNSIKGSSSKRKYCHNIEKHTSTAYPPNTSSLHHGIVQVAEDYDGTPMSKDLSKPQKRRKTQNRLGSGKVRTKGKNENQSQFNNEASNCCFEGATHQKYSTPIDELVCIFKDLNLEESNISVRNGEKAIVLYKGEGSLVPYEGFVKKRKPRPKVDLDPETERTWRLLMGGSENVEEIDRDKEKWWEQEREVFRGRADSFIARMHLVQGDRRFSKWKGSVVDSVIGVFLTQNVSDHLSSSAFMSLAARFPLKSAKEPEVCIVNQDVIAISYNGESSPYHQGLLPPQYTIEHWQDSETSRIERGLKEPNNQGSGEEIISSQDSPESSITEPSRGIRSCSGSNSEAEGPATEFESTKTQLLNLTNSLQVGKPTLFQEFYNSVNGLSTFNERTKGEQVLDAECAEQKSRLGNNDSLISYSGFNQAINFGFPQKQVPLVPSTDQELHNSEEPRIIMTYQSNDGASSQQETISGINKLPDINNGSVSIQEVGRSLDTSTEKQWEPLASQVLQTINPYEPLSMHLVHLQDDSQSGSNTKHQQSLSNHHLAGKKGMQLMESVSTSQKLGRRQDDKVKDSPNFPDYIVGFQAEKMISEVNGQAYSGGSTVEPQPQEQFYSSGTKYTESKVKISKARKVKPETEKKKVIDWDNLRKEVEANGGKKERSKETMDSLDYEAVRCASVEEISETIRERGMNNMLAERIKDFLNRLVREHEGIDLEWLRSVPPDKAKDYLLSIRGLGLKSVECVRLLTLHHLAFPVDTNVGRIAVRLGWVPLQPLPESLQLHLLEMYPILESIQKYLWPRLCKLDQRTLYELHYQLITFGKVFCTKSKPNCNACPMRAECRHFASAFASARLALPGPEEKRIVTTPASIATERTPALNMNPVLLPLPDNNLLKATSSEIGNCEPIIEVPATPEEEYPDTEALERDIEDSFWEDPDEIPTIELDKEKLSKTVQEFIAGDLVGGDMSRALIALNLDRASIPTPKLKNVSRLRTEHQVYELPDSHPLLDKMDKREPDDPSPYLLAIWTPGETANSIEPPERRCISQDSNNLCNDNTCYSCNSIREANSQTVRGTILIPCRTATRGSFPLNGTYFQVNEVFADNASSIQPIDVPREWIWNLPRRTVYFGTSVTSIFKGLSTQGIQQCFWRGFVCVRGFDQETRAPRPLIARLHFPPSKLAKAKK